MNAKLDISRNKVWRLFLTTHATAIDLIERELAEAGLPPLGWYDVLFALEEAQDRRLRMNELAANIVLSRSNLTRLVDRLEAAQLLYRESCPTDKRGAFAVVTDKGLEMRQKMWSVYAQGIATHFACHIDDNQASVLNELFARIIAANKSY